MKGGKPLKGGDADLGASGALNSLGGAVLGHIQQSSHTPLYEEEKKRFKRFAKVNKNFNLNLPFLVGKIFD